MGNSQHVAHMVISKTKGKFTKYSGFIEMDPDTQKVDAIKAVIQTKLVNTDHKTGYASEKLGLFRCREISDYDV